MAKDTTFRSAVFGYAGRYVTERAALDPIRATEIGVEGYDHLLPDYSPAGRERDAAFTAAALETIAAIEAVDDVDRIAKAVMAERLEARSALERSGEIARTFSVLWSPVSDIRQVFELMAATTPAELDAVTERLTNVRGALDSWRASLAEVAPRATEVEACGQERYARWARNYCGMDLDFDELYEWGWADLRRINARMWEIAREIAPDATTLLEVATALDADDARAVFGTDQLLERLEAFTQSTVEALDGVHFDIDPRIRRCDARLAPEGSAAAPYYISPSEDLSRPGTTWFPTLGETRFPWWRSVSTWYHESVPGHHLQDATALIEVERLSRFQRVDAWTSGYGEGRALYAERLMDELGGYGDPGDELGYLVGQGLRAARIVVDLGLHLGYAAPDDLGTLAGLGDCSKKPWTPEMAVGLLDEWALSGHPSSVSEVDRYLGNPGQAISYKVGEREWLAAREEAKARLGDAFSLKAFHSAGLRMGPMGLEPFRRELARSY